jgi:hypothetical protein
VNKLIKIIVLILFFSAFYLKASVLDNVYRIEIKDSNNKTISKGTGFLIEKNQEKYIFTSFHVLNSKLIKARRINAIEEDGNIYEDLKVVFYDDVHDLLVLKPDAYVLNTGLRFSSTSCNKTSVVGYNKDKKYALSTGTLKELDGRTYLKSISTYLKAGFSGAPVLNDTAEVCGMVVLSSERNSRSIALSKDFLKNSFNNFEDFPKTISELRKKLNIEFDVFSKEDLIDVFNQVIPGNQIVINIKSRISKINLSNINNVVFMSDGNIYIENFSFQKSSNILIENLLIGNVSLNKVNNFSITLCHFLKNDALKIVASSNLSFLNNVFLSDKPNVSLFSSDFNYKMLSYNKAKNPIEVRIN